MLKQWVIPLLVMLAASSCSSPTVVQETAQQKLAKLDMTLGYEITQQFEPLLNIKRDSDISVYLRKVAKGLVDATPELNGGGVGVLVIEDRESKWHNFGLPSQRIYLSSGLLRVVNHENEIAAIIAIQLSHISNKNILKRFVGGDSNSELRSSDPLDQFVNLEPTEIDDFFRKRGGQERVKFFGTDGIFSFSDKMETEAVKAAVGILYRAGYDSRGIITLLHLYKDNMRYSPYEGSTLEHFIEAARREIAVYAPLRNPIVRTKDFLTIRKRMRRL